MAKIIIEFDLYEEREEYEAALHVRDMQGALCNIQSILRSHDKYESYKNRIDDLVKDIRNVIEENDIWRFL